jgi:hypothetical protein
MNHPIFFGIENVALKSPQGRPLAAFEAAATTEQWPWNGAVFSVMRN